MNQYHKTLLFSAPLEKVWGIWIDVEKTPEWVHGVEASEPGEGEMSEGYSWKEMCQFDNMPVPMEHTVTDYEPLRRTVIFTVLPMGGTLEKKVLFKASGSGTQVDMEATWDLGMIGVFLNPEKIREKMEEGFERTAERWKERAEKN